MAYSLIWDGQGLIKHLTGFVSAEEFMESSNASTSHPLFDNAKYVINDFTDVTGHQLNKEAVEHVAVMRLGASAGKRHLRVLYVSKDPAIKDFTHNLLAPPFDGVSWETKCFDSMAEATDWLREQPPLAWQRHSKPLS